MTAAGPATDGPVLPREAASVVLLRDSHVGLQVWLMERAATLAFAASMTVFPGGSVDRSDVRLAFACDDGDAVPLPVKAAAFREVFEETGIVLGEPGHALAGHRAGVEDHSVDLPELLAEHGIRPDPSLLRPWARWITPADQPRRYDTWFFVAACPAGVEPWAETGEAVGAGWAEPAAALADGDAGRRGLMTPTRAVLSSLLDHGTVADVLAAAGARDLQPVQLGRTPRDPTIA